jgi:hypothetical protein
MLKFATAALAIALVAVSAAAQAPTLQILQPDGPNLPSELWYGNIKVKPIRLRPCPTTPCAPIPITIDDSDFFVSQNYVDFLARFADPSGLNYWTTQITACGTDASCLYNRRVGVSAAFFIEQEFGLTGRYVYDFYAGSLGRQPAFGEFMPDRLQIDASNLEATKTAYAIAFVQRPLFLTKYPASMSNDQFVNALLATMKAYDGVDLSSQAAGYISQLNGGAGRGAVVRQIIENQSFVNAEFNPSFVLMQYFGFLRRDVDPAGYQFWLGKVATNYHEMVCSFITSAEYQLRFGSVVTQNDSGCKNVQ